MGIVGIVVHVSERVSPTSIPTEDQINDIIDGVPFQIRVNDADFQGAMGAADSEHRPLTSGMAVLTKGSE